MLTSSKGALYHVNVKELAMGSGTVFLCIYISLTYTNACIFKCRSFLTIRWLIISNSVAQIFRFTYQIKFYWWCHIGVTGVSPLFVSTFVLCFLILYLFYYHYHFPSNLLWLSTQLDLRNEWNHHFFFNCVYIWPYTAILT